MERRSTSPKKSPLEQVIETHRDTLTDDEMEVLLTLHEQGSVAAVALELDWPVDRVEEVVERYMPKKKERLTKDGEAYRKRLSQTAVQAILETHDDLNDEERRVLGALIGADNQVIAAHKLGIKHTEFDRVYTAIRKKHNF